MRQHRLTGYKPSHYNEALKVRNTNSITNKEEYHLTDNAINPILS
jgi:hypothetical protein